MELLEALLFLLLMFSVVQSKNQCPTSNCGNFQMRHPFKLEGQQTQNCHYTDLACNRNQNIVVLELPLSGDFYIDFIDYDSSTIGLYDPDNCLPRRLMMNLTLQDSPFEAKDNQIFTFYNCPSEAVKSDFAAIDCLSNSTNAVVAIPSVPSQEMENSYACSVISTSVVPVSWSDSYDLGRNNDIVLKWSVSGSYDCTKKDGWKLNLISKVFVLILMIPAIAMILMVLFVCMVCCISIHMVNSYSGDRERAIAYQMILARMSTLPTTFNTATPSSTGNATGLDDSRINSCSELIVLDLNENGSITPGLTEKYSCSICLEEYGAKEKVRLINLCQHCFHVDCIDQWLRKNSTCPICRFSLLDVKV